MGENRDKRRAGHAPCTGLPVLVFTFFVRAYLVRGLMTGGLKE
jgi:ABC-type glycerol-3-phosphate transport system permease component